MKSSFFLCPFLWALFVFALISTKAPALPPDVENLIQADKYAEALTKVNALLQQTPDNQELLSARKELLSLVPDGNTSSVTASPPVPEPKRQPKELSPLDAKELELIMNDLNKKAGDARKPILKELESRTGALIGTYPDATNLWAMRALAVLELEQAAAAKEAGANLLRLGADRSTNDQMLSLLAMLKRKGWLKTPEQMEEERRIAAKEEAEAKIRRAVAERKAEEARRRKEAFEKTPEGKIQKNREAGMVDDETANFWRSIGKSKPKK